jgi:HTH-type transcriptional regulator/antitoxin HipB
MKNKLEACSLPHKVTNANELGEIIRGYRKSQKITLEKVSGLANVGTRFLSELERGKETAELGKAINIINKLGLEIIIQPRGYSTTRPSVFNDIEK